MLAIIATGVLVLLLVGAGLTVTVLGLRDDLRRRRRGYRRRTRRIPARDRAEDTRPASS